MDQVKGQPGKARHIDERSKPVGDEEERPERPRDEVFQHPLRQARTLRI